MPRRHAPIAAIVAANALLAVVVTYAVLRAYDVLFKSEPNPATVIVSAKIAMFWRLGVGAYVAGMIAFVVYFAARKNLGLTTRVTAHLVTIAFAIVALQGVFLP